MFKVSKIENQDQKPEAFNLLKLGLKSMLKLSEFLVLLLLAAGLNWRLTEPLIALAGPLAGAGLGLALMLALIGLPRLIWLYCLDRLNVDFGLDPRPGNVIFKSTLGLELKRGLLLWLLSLLLYGLMLAMNLWLWTTVGLVLGLGLTVLDAYHPGLLRPAKLRPLADDELSPALMARLEKWSHKTKLNRQNIFVDQTFRPELERPGLSGLGAELKLIIPQKALVAYPTRALNLLVATAVMEHLTKAQLSYFFLRICAVAVAAPLASLLLGLSGAVQPMALPQDGPALVSLVWLALWLAGQMAALAVHLTRRSVEIQAAAAASIILNDEDALTLALDTRVERNLEEPSPPAWREFFLPSCGRRHFLKRAGLIRYLSETDTK